MRPLNRKQKILGSLALAALGLLLAPFVAVQVQERIFRHRAEQLLADMRSLQSRKANLTEIQAVFNRWDLDEGPCSQGECRFDTSLSYSTFDNVNLCEDKPNWHNRWLRVFRIYGGRLARVRARAVVRHGVSEIIYFQIDIENFSHPKDAIYYYCGKPPMGVDLVLSGMAASVPRFSIRDDWRGLTIHSNYFIDERYPPGWHPRSPDVYAEFGPNAAPADISRLASFDLSCLTRWVACRKPEDIMPEAAAQFARESPLLAQARKEQVCSPDIVALMARDAGRAGVVEMTGSRIEHMGNWGDVPIPKVRLLQDIGPASSWKTGESHELLILNADVNHLDSSLPPEVRLGNRFIMLAESGLNYRWVETDRCGVVPLNPANLEFVRQAIAGNLPPTKP